jgi:GNAT superfamily N-acetyltransferase
MTPPITIRPLEPGDSIDALTALLHRAYAPLGARGLNYTAVDQTADVTRSRIARGVCLVAVTPDRCLSGTVLYHRTFKGTVSVWLERDDVAFFGQLAVEPDMQKSGLGARLVEAAERRARQEGAAEMAVDTAEPAGHLVSWYARLGYRRIATVQWRGKNYRSVIMSKTL